MNAKRQLEKLTIRKVKEMKIKLLSAVLIFSFIIFYGCSSKKEQRTDDVIPVKIIELKKEKVQRTINVSGIFTTEDETYLSFKTGGIIKSVYVNEGDKVKKGQLLAVLELNEIQAQVSQAVSAHEKALRDYNRVQNLYKDSVAALSQLQDAKTGFDIASEQLTIAKYNLDHSEIRAIHDGYILKKFVNEGQIVSPGMPVFQTNGAERGDWILKAGISDHDWSKVNVRDKAFVQSDIDPARKIEASVIRKSESIDPYSSTFYVELKINTSDGSKIASGLFGKAQIFPDHPSSMWVIPYQSILDGDGKTGYVFTTNDMQKTNKVKVNIVDLDKDMVYVDAGLDNSRYLITSGSAYLTDNSPIKIDKN